MTTSNTTTFDLSIDDLIEEAFERCGMRPTAGYQLTSARRSLNLLFLDWANRGLNLWTIEQATFALVQGTSSISLPTDVVNVLEAIKTFVYYRIRRIQDAGAYTNTSDVNFRFLPCLASGLAYYLALKFAADRAGALKAIYEEDFQRAALEDRDTASVQFVPDLGV